MPYSTELKSLQCGNCGIWHAIPLVMYKTCEREGGFWLCPNGHSRGFGKGTLQAELEKVQRQRDQAQQQIARVEDERREAERKLAAQKGVTTRLKKRVANGVCPCCKRSFKNLHQHMANQHPEYAHASK